MKHKDTKIQLRTDTEDLHTEGLSYEHFLTFFSTVKPTE